MIIKKNGALSRVLKEVLKGNKTENVSTLLNNFLFEKGKGITLYFLKNIKAISIKDENVDFDACVANDFIVTALVSELEKGDVSVSINELSNVVFNKYAFETNSDFYPLDINKGEPFISFNQEQFKNLEKDFELTVGNYFVLSKATDVICFAFNEGKLYKLLPGCNVYEISKFDGTIDTVELERCFGHSICIYIMPHKIFDFMKNEYNVSISYNDNVLYFEGNEIMIASDFSSSQLGTNVFMNNISIINKDDKIIATLKDFSSLKEYVKNISSNLFEESEVPNIFVKAENGKIVLDIEDSILKFDVDLKENIAFNVNLLAFNYILQNLPEDTTISKNDYYLIFKTKDKIIFIINKEF